MPGRGVGVVAVVVSISAMIGCSGGGDLDTSRPPSASTTVEADDSPDPAPLDRPSDSPPPAATIASPTPSTSPEHAEPRRFDEAAAMDLVHLLAGRIGPREATSEAFDRAARRVATEFTEAGYDVRRQPVPVPAGDSWGTPVEAGRSVNVIADPPGFDPTEPHLVIGAHLDSVARSPGAEDNASGVAVLVELARVAAADRPWPAVRFIAFGAEEPRGPGDRMHHFGSRRYVERLTDAELSAVVGMVSMDRVGVHTDSIGVCVGVAERAGARPTGVQREMLAAADRSGVAAHRCENRSSDHWSFEKAGVDAVRLGSVPYRCYHSACDRPDVVDADQLGRTGRLMAAWLTGASASD